MKKNGFLTFCFSFIPGIGQMYQGYMKRGVSLLTLFIAIIAISGVTSMGVFGLPAIIVYAYSFFDTWNIRNKKEGDKYPEDVYIWDNDEIRKLFGKTKSVKKNSTIGIILLLFGIYLLFGTVFRRIAYDYNITFVYRIINEAMSYLPPIIIAAVSIGLGIKFISKK